MRQPAARSLRHTPGMPPRWPLPLAAGKTQGEPSLRGIAVRTASAGAPRGTIFAPVLESGRRSALRSKSTCSQRNEAISFLRAPVGTSSRRMASELLFTPCCSALAKASPRRANSTPERNRSRLLGLFSLKPLPGLSARSFCSTAHCSIAASTTVARAAAAGPPFTMALPRFRVFSSALVLPSVTSRWNF